VNLHSNLELKTAFTVLAPLEQLSAPIGELSTGGTRRIATVKPGGTVKSAPGFEPALNGELVSGQDWVLMEPGQRNMRADARCLMKTDQGFYMTLSINGIVHLSENVIKALRRMPDAKTTDWGLSVATVVVTTGELPYKALEEGLYVGTSRYIVSKEDVKDVTVEWKVSQVLPVKEPLTD